MERALGNMKRRVDRPRPHQPLTGGADAKGSPVSGNLVATIVPEEQVNQLHGQKVELLRVVFEDNGMNVGHAKIVKIVDTATKMGSEVGDFFERYAEDLSEKVGSLILKRSDS